MPGVKLDEGAELYRAGDEPADVFVVLEGRCSAYISASPTARPHPTNGHAAGDADTEPIWSVVPGCCRNLPFGELTKNALYMWTHK